MNFGDIKLSYVPSFCSEFTVDHLPATFGRALPSSDKWIVAYTPNNSDIIHDIMRNFKTRLNTNIPKPDLEVICNIGKLFFIFYAHYIASPKCSLNRSVLI